MLKRIFLVFMLISFLLACTPPQPSHTENICQVFRQHPKWYWAAKKAKKKWGVPVYVQMAIIHQESHFDAKARPERGKLLWVIPWKRPSSAYGYTQALDQTWDNYQKNTGHHGSRKNFVDGVDFVAWYAHQAHKRAKIPSNDAYNLYLAYHEGIGGYQRGTYNDKKWLINVAHRVQRQSSLYQVQLAQCKKKFHRPWWYL